MRFNDTELEAWLRPPVEAAQPGGGVQIITPHPLAAAALQRQHAESQLERGFRAWPQPSILSLSGWLQQSWREARARLGEAVPLLLSPAQELFLWTEAIRQSGADVLDVAATARSAMKSARFVADWNLPLDHLSWESTEDAAQFRRWLADVEGRCQEERWLSATRLLPFFLNRLHSFSLPARVVLAGLPEIPETLRLLITSLRASGVIVDEMKPAGRSPSLIALPCSDLSEEFDAAARWARARLTENPAASLAIFVQNLSEHRSRLERTLAAVLQPASMLQPVGPSPAPNPRPFHIHCGHPHHQQPVIASALAIIDLARPLVPMTSANAFLCSPYLPGFTEEKVARSFADASLRRSRELEAPLRVIESAIARCPELAKVLPRLRGALREMPSGVAEPAVWSRFWRRLLKAAGWPGDQPLSPSESDAVDEWLDLLSSFDSLGLTGCRLTPSEALSQLHSLVAEPGPSNGDPFTPIHVLEAADAMPLHFDGAWLVGASELEWPPATFAPAYVPLSLLRTCGLAIATPRGRRARAHLLSSYVQSSASTVIASYSTSDAPGTKLSGLFAPLREEKREGLYLWEGDVLLDQVTLHALEEIEDTNGPPLTTKTLVPGGSRLFKSQSDCPFQAFARWRLLAESLEEGEFSYDARERGKFLHTALDVVWSELQTSARLRSLTPAELEGVVSRAVRQALSEDRAESDFRVQLRESEHERLVPLIVKWLEVEKQRPGNFKIHEAEKSREFQLSKLHLRLRADRVDKLDDGGFVVIDYKSGRIKRADLESVRPSEPQLLAYAAMLASECGSEDCVEGLYFANIRGDACAAEGYGRRPYFNEKPEPGSWALRLRQWRSVISDLAQEFEDGAANRTLSPAPCKFCQVKSVCRIEEARRDNDMEDAE